MLLWYVIRDVVIINWLDFIRINHKKFQTRKTLRHSNKFSLSFFLVHKRRKRCNICCDQRPMTCHFKCKKFLSILFQFCSVFRCCSYLCDEDDWSKRFVIGSSRSVAGALNGPSPARFAAATLTVYVTPSVRLAKRSVGVAASTVTFVKIRDLFMLTSMPRTTMWYVWRRPVK